MSTRAAAMLGGAFGGAWGGLLSGALAEYLAGDTHLLPLLTGCTLGALIGGCLTGLVTHDLSEPTREGEDEA